MHFLNDVDDVESTGKSQFTPYRRMAENGFALAPPPPHPPREFCRHILSCRELKAESFKTYLHKKTCFGHLRLDRAQSNLLDYYSFQIANTNGADST